MDILLKFLSRKLLVVLGTVAIAFVPTLAEKTIKAIDWKVYALAGGYIIANVVQHIVTAWIQAKYTNK